MDRKPRVLVAPLDWGLGHTTRCIPVVNELIAQGADILLAGNEIQKKILCPIFPQAEFLTLAGYNIRYSHSRKGFIPRMLAQLPRIAHSIRREHRWLEQIIREYQPDAVISDNRYGLYHSRIPTVILTHQLEIQVPGGRWLKRLVQRMNFRLLGKFSQCWIPDFEGPLQLGGVLSHPAVFPKIPCLYIGSLSRLQPGRQPRKPGHLLVIISGPEPQRSHLESLIFRQLTTHTGTATVVLGRPGARVRQPPGPIEVFDHLSPADMTAEINRASYIICRSGYSSVMDVNAVQARSIMVPTPGQSEQEYLAAYLSRQGFTLATEQEDFDLGTMLARAATGPYRGFIPPQPELLQQAVRGLLDAIKKAGPGPAANIP
ncbi:glycosyltransferase [Niabella terrae]